MAKAAIFDFDGTLIDSEPFYAHSFENLLAKRNFPIPPSQRDFQGIGLSGTIAVLKKKFPSTVDWDAFGKEFGDSFMQCTLDAPVFAGAENILRELYKNMPLAICSNSSRKIVSSGLEKNGLQKYFEVIVTREDFVNAKPDPEPYYKTCEKLKVIPEECVVFEDSLPGLTSAIAAGCKVIAFTAHNKLQKQMKVSYQTNSFSSITPELIAKL